MTTQIPCRAKDPDTCKYHGAQRRAEAALLAGDTDTWLRENEIMLRNSNIDEITDFIKEQAPKPAPTLTAQQVIELPIDSEATDKNGNTWRKTNTGNWQQIQADGTLSTTSRNSRYFTLENQPTLKSMPEGAIAMPHYQPGYPKRVAWQSLKPGDQISGGKVVSVKPTTTASKVNVTLEQADGRHKMFAANKYNKQTVVGKADTAPVYAQHDLEYRLNKASISLEERMKFGLGRADNFTYAVGGYAQDVQNQVETPARAVYNKIADTLLRSATLEQAPDYISGWGVQRDRLLTTLQSMRTFDGANGRLSGLDSDQQEEVDRAHRYAFRILTDQYGTVNSKDGQADRVQLRRLLSSLDKAYWEQPAPTAA